MTDSSPAPWGLGAAEPALRQVVTAVEDGADGARLGLVVVDPTSGDRVAWGSAHSFDAASVIKVPILVTTLRAVERGALTLDERVPVPHAAAVGGSGVLRELPSVEELSLRDLVTLMIVVSDNTATNLVIDVLGGCEPVNALLRDAGLTGTRLERKLMDDSARARGEHNVTTAADVAGLLTALVRGELLDEPATGTALGVLGRQQVRDRLPRRLPAGVHVAHKTGELEGLRHDAGVLYLGPAGDRPVVAAVLTQGFTDLPTAGVGAGGAAADVAADVGRILYDAYS